MNVVIFNTAVGTSNNGDYIIMDSAKKAMMPLLEKSYVMEYATHVKNLGILHYIFKSSKREFVNKADYKFIFGTNILTTNVVKSIRQWPVLEEQELYKNVILMGVGMTYSNISLNEISKRTYSKILRRDIIHSVRDDMSKNLLESKLGVRAINTGCPTLWGIDENKCNMIPKKKSMNAIISISGYKSQKDVIKDQLLCEIVEKNYESIYLWVQTSEDYNYFRGLKHTKEFKCIYSLVEFEKCCKTGNVDYIGTRLHGGVFAIQNGVRTIVVGIDHRAKEFSKSNNLPVVSRNNLSILEEKINHDFATEIVVNHNAIREWLGQFPYFEHVNGFDI